MKLMSLGAALIVAAVAFNAPPTAATRQTPKPANVPVIAVPPFRGAVLYDVSASRDEARIAASSMTSRRSSTALRVSGGEVGFGLIREDSDHPLLRCYVPAPARAPARAPAPRTARERR